MKGILMLSFLLATPLFSFQSPEPENPSASSANLSYRDNQSNDPFFLYNMWSVSTGVSVYL
ncbi:MAG: hypothetical protein GY765_34790 [bacterium]|nr:hypothetical protein [bacterium]